jgi:hypothetical protein
LCLDNSIDAARRTGKNVFDNIDKQAIVIAYAAKKGVPIVSHRAADITAGAESENSEDAQERQERED